MKKIITLLLAVLLCFGASGCSLLENEIDNRRNEREYCTLNKKDATIFTYSGKEYAILEDTVARDALGSWVGYIQKFAVLDKQNAVLELRDVELSESAIGNIPDKAAYVVQFFNIYLDKDTDGQNLIIDVDGGFHKAIPKEQANDTSTIIAFEELDTASDGSISIHSENCTQIVYLGNVYQITETTIDEHMLDTFLGVIAEHRVFDANTNREIPKSELGKIETTPGELSQQVRTSWSYGTVYSISNTNKSQSIAIEINNQYLRADVVQ